MTSPEPRSATGPSRPPPFRPVPAHDASLLRLLFRGARFPDTEWWSHGAHFRAVPDRGRERELSLFMNVQLFGEPLRGEVAPVATIAIRDVKTGERWIQSTRGAMGSSRACRFSSADWLLLRLDPETPTFDADALGLGLDPDQARARFSRGAYVCEVRAPGLEATLFFRQEESASLGDGGWVDYNPEGAVPLWTSAKVRIATPSGTIALRESSGERRTYRVVSGHAHFEQQAIVPSATKVPVLQAVLRPSSALALFAEAARHRVRWHWFRARLARGVNLTAHRVWNPRTGAPFRDHASVIDADGAVVVPEDFEVSAPRDEGRSIPSEVKLGFRVVPGAHRVPPGRYEAVFRHDPGIDWFVPVTGPLGLSCRAHEAHCTVAVTRDGRPLRHAVGGQETIDLTASLVPEA